MYSDSTVKRPGLSSKTKQILVGVAGVFALLLGALLIYSVLVTPERQPYRDALAQYKQVYDANVAFTSAAIALNGTLGSEEQLKANTDEIEKAKTNLEAQTKALGTQPVLTEGEGKELYDTFAKKIKEYIAYSENTLESRQAVRPILSGADCSQALASQDSYADKVDAVKACADKFKTIGTVSDADYQTLVDVYANKTAQLVVIFESIAEIEKAQEPDTVRQDELVAEHDDVLAEIEEANKAFATGLQTNKSKVDITASAQALDNYLTRKSSVF